MNRNVTQLNNINSQICYISHGIFAQITKDHILRVCQTEKNRAKLGLRFCKKRHHKSA